MTIIIKATGDGACLFNAVSIGLAIEILSGRLDEKKSSPAYELLLEEFHKQHSAFDPQSWDNLKRWLFYYNDQRDIELILGPVLFNLNKHYATDIRVSIINELTNLVWKNQSAIASEKPWWELSNKDLFRQLESLEINLREDLLKQLKAISPQLKVGSNREDIKSVLEEHAQDIFQKLVDEVKKINDFQRGFSCGDLQQMTDALSINLIENSIKNSSKENTICLRNKDTHWDLIANDDSKKTINLRNPQVRISSHEAYNGECDILPPPANYELDKEVIIRQESIDNPGKGDCAFYAFAIGLIDIIQEENTYQSKNMFMRWIGLQDSQHEAICRFNIKNPSSSDLRLLNNLQQSLRLITYHSQLDQLRYACVNPGRNNYTLLGNSNYIAFAELYHEKDVDPRFNVFAKSKEIEKRINQLKKQKIPFKDSHLILANLFIELLYGKGFSLPVKADAEPKSNSPILAGMTSITKPYFWGTHSDLDNLANVFQVNFHPLLNSTPLQEFRDLEGHHTITVNNLNNTHWVTQVEAATAPFNKQTAKADLKPEVRADVQTDVGDEKLLEAPGSQVTESGASASNLEKQIPEDLGSTLLKDLKKAVSDANHQYQGYSNSLWFSLFHRHGGEGRDRANRFARRFNRIKDYSVATQDLIDFLTDPSNGNTHPHSFRTMLLWSVMEKPKPNLNYLSKKYNYCVDELAKKFEVELDSLNKNEFI